MTLAVLPAAGAACLAALALAGCAKNSGAAAAAPIVASNYCSPFAEATNPSAAAPASDPAAAFEECVHRWGYALAPARDDAQIVAQATVDACASQLSRWNQQTLSQYQQQQGAGQGGYGQAGPPTALSLTTGQNTDLYGERSQYAQSRALFYVVQARAGHCAAPPAATLAANPPSGAG